ncbi:MAG: glycosyl transferase, family 2 [Candidatus Acidoferrum typicum]|nr:glycosyl transferase, family 2 [Candidatus Acidoferrum typicum]
MHKVSIVTISFNQGEFLERAIWSVVEQDYPDIEYIVVDPGSTDGSRDIIERYRSRIARVIYEPDRGPADGLNKGFARATGDIFGFLNSDDVLFPGAVRNAVAFLNSNEADVVSAHATVIDAEDRHLRMAYSEPFSLRMFAYGACVLVQPSTFFQREAFERAQGFNVENRATWDGELWVDMALSGARFTLADGVWSGYRLHSQSITSSRKLLQQQQDDQKRMFRKILGRDSGGADRLVAHACRVRKHLRSPRALYERVVRGPISGRFA